MLNKQLATRYARAVFEIAQEQKELEAFGQQLKSVREVIASESDLAMFMYHPHIKPEAKKEVVEKLFSGQLAEDLYKFLLLLIDKRRESLLGQIAEAYEALANEAQNIVEAKVLAARPLSPKLQEKLTRRLCDTTGKTVNVTTKVDAGILGGLVVQIGDKLIDGSVVRQMKTLRQSLLRDEVAKSGVTE